MKDSLSLFNTHPLRVTYAEACTGRPVLGIDGCARIGLSCRLRFALGTQYSVRLSLRQQKRESPTTACYKDKNRQNVPIAFPSLQFLTN